MDIEAIICLNLNQNQESFGFLYVSFKHLSNTILEFKHTLLRCLGDGSLLATSGTMRDDDSYLSPPAEYLNY